MRTRPSTALAILGMLCILYPVIVFGQSLDPVATWATLARYEYEVDSEITYKLTSSGDLRLDVITPGARTTLRPTLIYFHGGGWSSGDKQKSALFPLVYLSRGFNVVNVDYRVLSEAPAPAAVQDCRCALRWVYEHAKEYGFDTRQLVVEGHSAGGHLALMTGMLKSEDGFDNECPGSENLRVAAIVDYYGSTDISDLLEGSHMQEYAAMWLGNLPNRLALAKQLSPLTYVHAGLPPIIMVHGDKDQLVPYEQSVKLHEALTRAGVSNQLVTVRGGGHDHWRPQDSITAQEEIFLFLQKQGILRSRHPRTGGYKYWGHKVDQCHTSRTTVQHAVSTSVPDGDQ